MSERRVKVACDGGLNDGNAVKLVQLAARAEAPVTISRDDAEPVAANHAVSVLALEIGEGEEVILASEDEAALDKLTELISCLAVVAAVWCARP
ncbi:HPr family phosphocarrier protein [Stackebrandtia nassauensis]|uniref:Phosphotransferase system, phosphocarrier protein HPr n=1 Tax=Stackebrandtia nassauensis (strain DSM 44728 / CIP 108903 / NRRL B-16338 / NBRC 102104 / LLR-40K-21) TaxID=446470 RepID=D3QBB6_STANL|nr:HPr family phosphocarrier protein [Stackebrandtia nassauensis]ADD40933.1 Phosphotransferase system, phosphocarrier protein HPr [Stackebrandtia nassauensis DSM 44728]